MKVLRGHLVCHDMQWEVSAEEFRKHNFGWSRTEVVEKLLKDLGIEVTDFRSVQVIPVDSYYSVVLRDQ